MLSDLQPTFLLASPDPPLLGAMEPVLLAMGASVEIVLTAESALASMIAYNPPALALLDVELPSPDRDMNIDELLASARANISARRLPIVLIAPAVAPEWSDRLAEGVVDDLLLRCSEPCYWRLRLNMVMRSAATNRELETLREEAVLRTQTDRLTGVYNRETLLTMLFRETDRVQRMQSSLSLILLDIDDFGHWNSRLGSEICDQLLCQVVARTNRLLRSYDLLGRPGKDEFLIVLPGCVPANAVLMAERLRVDVFSLPFHLAGESIRLSACFGIAVSNGRSPVVVLREAEQALIDARAAGPESIQCFNGCSDASGARVTYLLPSSGDELLAW
ncbi:MAG: diguanylate cyclase [Terracidiphilus sp.]|jgi:diguanylate cyclase (GGDEF)-like protein